MKLEISEISYARLKESIPSISQLNPIYIVDLTEVSQNFKYYQITNSQKEIVGTFGLYFTKRKGFLHVSNAPFFQDIGLNIRAEGSSDYKSQSFIKIVLGKLAEFLKAYKWINITLPHQFTDGQPFIWENFEAHFRYTYLLDLKRPLDSIELGFSKGLKKTQDSLKSKELAYLFESSEEIKKLVVSSSVEHRSQEEKKFFEKLFQQIIKSENVECISCNESGSTSCGVFIKSTDTVVYLLGGSHIEKGSKVGSALLLKAIEKFNQDDFAFFDFEGSMIPGVERFFRSFGAKMVPLVNIQKKPKVLKLIEGIKS